MSPIGAPSDETAGAGTDRRHRVIGRHVLRRQDPALLTGRGMFVADVQRPGTLHMAVLRSRYAHARIAGIDTTACRLVPGVALTVIMGIFTPEVVRGYQEFEFRKLAAEIFRRS